MKKLENKVAVITGGNSGIGLATAKLFASEGASVAITGRDTKTIDGAVKEIGHDAIGIASDVSNISTLDAFYKSIKDAFGNIDVLVVNAGIYIPGTLADFTEAEFDKTSNINFKGVFFSIQKALPYLNDGASVIITSSSLATMGILSDPGNKVLDAYGVKEQVFNPQTKVSGRETFVISLDGNVAYSFRDFMKGDEHSKQVLAYLNGK